MTGTTDPGRPRTRRRWPLVILLLASLAWLGLVAGTAAGAKWFVPGGSGLAGPAIALGYGVLGAAAALALGAALGWKAPDRLLRAATAAAAVLALLAAGWFAWRIVALQAGAGREPAPGPTSSATISAARRSASSTQEFMLTPR